MDIICGIYCITNNINGKKYVGLSKNCYKRWSDHYSKSYNSNRKDDIEKALYLAMRKYGRENFSFEILEECEEDKLKEREIYWINKLDSYHTGYNETFGGDNFSPEHVLRGEKHGMAKLTEEDVKFCRECYKNGEHSKDIWQKYFSDKVKYSGFQRMWHGKTWKHIMPEVFENNPHPRQKYNDEIKKEIKFLYDSGMSIAEIYRYYDEQISRTTIHNITHNT